MSTQTEQEILKRKQKAYENHEESRNVSSKIPIVFKRNALVEISNINRNDTVLIKNSLKLNGKIINKTNVEIKNEIKKLNDDNNNNNIKKKFDEKPVENIDEFYKDNLFLVPEYAENIYNYLRELELKYRIKKWPFNSNVNEQMRATLIDWLVEIHLEYDLLQETLHLAVSLVDRYLQIANDVTVKNLQLVGVCCMAIATKYEEVQPLAVSDFLYLCNNTYKKYEFLKMERTILNNIDFQIARPLTIYFLRRYSLASRADRKQHVCAKYLLDLALLDASLCHVRPSLLAACAFFISTCLLKDKFDANYWNDQLIFYSKYEYENIRIYTSKFCKLVLSNDKYFKTVKKKYSAKEFDSVSNRIHNKMHLLIAFSESKPHGSKF
ncbi:hypothetical protein O3M35_012265 [Rhynocoris fuscipes]|uniref:G2/mitotic-specific cyclin-B3 n=1 Tax=Rhynocoris fuscipes TaxID=488301 RepID=A0AAW1CTF3_9HEMI